MRAGQQLEHDYRPVARDSCSSAVEDFALRRSWWPWQSEFHRLVRPRPRQPAVLTVPDMALPALGWEQSGFDLTQ